MPLAPRCARRDVPMVRPETRPQQQRTNGASLQKATYNGLLRPVEMTKLLPYPQGIGELCFTGINTIHKMGSSC